MSGRDASYSLYWSQPVHRDINITWDVSTLHSKLCTSVWQGRVCCGLTWATNNEPLSSSFTHFYWTLQVIRQSFQSTPVSLSLKFPKLRRWWRRCNQYSGCIVMGWFEFPHLILRDRLHINYSIIELNYYLTAQLEGTSQLPTQQRGAREEQVALS